NTEALPRAFVPASVQTEPDKKALLRMIGAAAFDPRQISYVEDALSLPSTCVGNARILDESPDYLRLEVDMQTSGLVVLADQWYEGWHARLDGQLLPVLRVNHALRGVVVPPGQATLEFNYLPRGYVYGLRLSLAGLAVLTLWIGFTIWRSRQ